MAAAHNSMRLASTLRQDAVHWHQGGHNTMLEACAGALHQCQRASTTPLKTPGLLTLKKNIRTQPAASLRPIENNASRAARAADSEEAGGAGGLSAAVDDAR